MKSEPFKSNKLNELIEFYVQTPEVLSFEMALEKLIMVTTLQNYKYIVNAISNHPDSSELDLSLYIHGIASPIYADLKNFIKEKLLSIEDKDAIEDLKDSLEKIAKS